MVTPVSYTHLEGAINDYLCDTIREVFNYAYIATVPNGTNTEPVSYTHLAADQAGLRRAREI